MLLREYACISKSPVQEASGFESISAGRVQQLYPLGYPRSKIFVFEYDCAGTKGSSRSKSSRGSSLLQHWTADIIQQKDFLQTHACRSKSANVIQQTPLLPNHIMIRPLALLRIVVPLYALFLLILYLRRDTSPPSDQETNSSPPLEILIPKTIHHVMIAIPKFKPNSHSISWQQSGWKVEYWTEDACSELAQELNASYLETFKQLPSAVLKSDFCRYMVMYGRGGVYNDLDVHLMKALPWKVMGPPRDGSKGPPSLIVGLEGDATTKGLPRSPQFVQWTIASVPKHPILLDALGKITERTPEFLKKQQADKNGDADVMNWTGPSVWTDAVLAYLDCTEVQLEKLRDLKSVVRIKDVLILPKRAFAVIQGEDHKNPDILVKHYFSGMWKHEKSWVSKLLPFG